jgi:hypothetical protein
MLTDSEREFLRQLRDEFVAHGGLAMLTSNPPVSCMQSLVDRGYCYLCSVPPGTPDARVMIGLTDAGREAIDNIAVQEAKPAGALSQIKASTVAVVLLIGLVLILLWARSKI